MALTGNFVPVGTKTTAAVGATNKVAALCNALFDAIAVEISKADTLTPKMQNKLAQAKAHVAANTAQIQTAVGL
jgi:hypothetical protein